jgi:putative addiction module component (TIGR02574 family)
MSYKQSGQDSYKSAADASAWNQEIARRIEDLDSGKAKTIPWEEVQKQISSRLIHGR